jgi:K+-sensing histidine kinase KdpD
MDAPTSCFFLAVMVSSLYGGKGPGLFAVSLSSLAFDYFFLRLDSNSTWIQRPFSDSDLFS